MKFKTPHVTKSKNIGNSENLWSLNKLPLTEQFGEFDLNFPSFAMDLNIDTKTGHAFSGNVVFPSYLYTNNNYHYRGNISTKAKLSIDGFDLFCDKYSDYSQIKTVVDIGGNDLQWISSFKSRNIDKECYVIDPIKIEDDGKIIQGVNVIGKFIENVNLKEIKPDLIIFRHTMEHIENPSELIESLIEQVSEDTKIIIEVPDLSSMIESLRFECVFHQHLHYFNSDTLSNIIQHSGGSVLGSEIDPSGSCGGTLRIAFTKKKNKQNEIIEINVKERIKKLKNGIELFEKKMALTRETINFLPFIKIWLWSRLDAILFFLSFEL